MKILLIIYLTTSGILATLGITLLIAVKQLKVRGILPYCLASLLPIIRWIILYKLCKTINAEKAKLDN